MKTVNLITLLSVTFISLIASNCATDDPCEIDPANCEPEEEIVGQKGNPQFNLQFTGPEQVDLDLYVEDPNGTLIYYGNPYSQSGGQLDVDCLCGDCPYGPNENIFWPTDGSAPRGIYRYWIDYYEACDYDNVSSAYTIRVLENGAVVDTYSGNLTSGKSTIWTYTH